MKLVRSLTLAAFAASLALAPASAAAAAPPPEPSAVAPTKCSLISFSKADVWFDATTKRYELVVAGTKSASNVEVQLTPVTYIRQPEYWLIMVRGCSRGIGLPVLTPYTARLDVTSTLGTEGVEVQGSDHSQRIPVK